MRVVQIRDCYNPVIHPQVGAKIETSDHLPADLLAGVQKPQ